MKYRQILFSSRLIRKIIRYILIIGLVSLILILSICYMFLWPRLKSTALKDALSRTSEISLQIENYISNLTDASQFIIASPTLKNVLNQYYAAPDEKNYNNVCLSLHELSSTMNNIRSVIVVSDNGETFNSIVNLKAADWSYFNEVNTDFADRALASYSFSPIYPLETEPLAYSLCYSVKTHMDYHDYIFYFFFNVNSVVTTCESLSANVFDSYCLALPDMTNASPFARLEQIPSQLSSSGKYMRADKGTYFKERIPILNWYFAAYSSDTTMHTAVHDIFLMVILFCILFFILTIILLAPAISRLVLPIYKLNAVMQKVSQNNIYTYSDIQTNDEIGDLSKVFNQMLESIQKHIHWKIEHEKKECQVRYNLLIAQIDNHFICNTMSIINSMARRNNTSDIIRANTALMRILQNCLRIKTYKITDTIAQELDILNQYMIIEKMRYENNAALIIDVPPELMNTEIPKNILQPIVENSFRHGLCNVETGEIRGTVTLTMTYDDTSIYITISDDGCGVSPEVLALLNAPDDFSRLTTERGKHIGLRNIYQRLKFIYNTKAASITFTSQPGFTSHIVVPLLPEEYDDARVKR